MTLTEPVARPPGTSGVRQPTAARSRCAAARANHTIGPQHPDWTHVRRTATARRLAWPRTDASPDGGGRSRSLLVRLRRRHPGDCRDRSYGGVHGHDACERSPGDTGSCASPGAPSGDGRDGQADELLIGVFGRRTPPRARPRSPRSRSGYTALTVGTTTGGGAMDTHIMVVTGVRRHRHRTGAFTASATLGASRPFAGAITTYPPVRERRHRRGEQCDDSNSTAGDCCSPSASSSRPVPMCRVSAGACDPAETCTGSSATCPADVISPHGAACGSAGNTDCDNPDTCNGVSVALSGEPRGPRLRVRRPERHRVHQPRHLQRQRHAVVATTRPPARRAATRATPSAPTPTPATAAAPASTTTRPPASPAATRATPSAPTPTPATAAAPASPTTRPPAPPAATATDTDCTNPDTCNGARRLPRQRRRPPGAACGDSTRHRLHQSRHLQRHRRLPVNDDGLRLRRCGDPTDTDCTEPGHLQRHAATCLANHEATGPPAAIRATPTAPTPTPATAAARAS